MIIFFCFKRAVFVEGLEKIAAGMAPALADCIFSDFLCCCTVIRKVHSDRNCACTDLQDGLFFSLRPCTCFGVHDSSSLNLFMHSTLCGTYFIFFFFF